MTTEQTTLLYKYSKKTPIRMLESKYNVGEKLKTGIRSSLRHSTAKTDPKFSFVAVALDKIIVDKGLLVQQSDKDIYFQFNHNAVKYEGTYNGEQINWVGKEPIENWGKLLPIIAWMLSTNANDPQADEFKEIFKDLKETPTPENAAFICDNYYYGFAISHPELVSFEHNISEALLHRNLCSGAYKNVEILSDMMTNVDSSGIAISESPQEEKEEEKDFTVKYKWNSEQLGNIPSKDTLKTFVMTDTCKSIASKVKYRMDKVLERLNSGKTGYDAIGADYINLLMVGRPATGKTALANAVAAMTGMPIYTIPFSKHTEEDTVEGKNKIVDGKINFVETDFLKAYENGGIIVCEEINLADPAVVMGSLGQAIEKPFILMKDGYIPVHRHPLCVIIATMNTGTAGSRGLNQALSSRFKNTYTLYDPDKNTFIKILSAAGYKKTNCRFVYDAYTKITNFLKSPERSQGDLAENITLRGCFGALECIEEGETGAEAIMHSLVGKIAEQDLETAKVVQRDIVDILPDINFR